MEAKVLKRFLAVTASLVTLAFVAAPISLAGEDEDDDGGGTPRRHATSGGGGDSGSASGGVQTGFGGMVASTEPGTSIPLALAGGGVVFLTLGGLASRKRRFE
jgi:hypothetical protein